MTLSILFLAFLHPADVSAVSVSSARTQPARAPIHHTDVLKDNAMDPYHVPEFTVDELVTGSKDEQLKQVLSSTGLLAVRIPVYHEGYHGENLLQGLCDCSAHTKSQSTLSSASGASSTFASIANSDEFLLADGTTLRQTIATATLGTDRPLPLPEQDIMKHCYPHDDGELAYVIKQREFLRLEHARDVVSQAANGAFLPALDRLLTGSSTSTSTNTSTSDPKENKNILLKTKDGKEYTTVTSIVNDAINLEHFHAYSHADSSTDKRQDDEMSTAGPALDWHTDGGLFLAFLPGRQCHHNNNNINAVDESFRIKIPNSEQEYHPVIFPSPSRDVVVAIMLGYGAEHWIQHPSTSASSSSSPVTLRATNHAVMMPQTLETRVWYGMMHLVPTDAIVVTPLQDDDNDEEMTFEELKRTSQSIVTHSKSRTFGDDASVPDNAIVIGSSVHVQAGNNNREEEEEEVLTAPSAPLTSTSRRRRLQHVGGQDECNNSNNPNTFFCWLSCLSIASDNDPTTLSKTVEENVNEGNSLYCIDPSILFITKSMEKAVAACADSQTGEAGGVMNQACGNYWHETVDGVQSYTDVFKTEDDNDENKGSGALTNDRYCYGATSMYMQGFEWEGTTCVVYLFSPWIITTRAAMAAACIGTILFGIVTEYVIRQRRKILSKKTLTGGKKMATSALMYGLQLTLGYLLMLVVMTYSGPLVMSVIIGIVMGHVIWNWGDVMGEAEKKKSKNDRGGSSNLVLEGSTPCCQNIIEEESDHDDDSHKHHTDGESICGCA